MIIIYILNYLDMSIRNLPRRYLEKTFTLTSSIIGML